MSNKYKLLLSLNDVAQVLPLKIVSFSDGSSPLPDLSDENAERLALENPRMRCVRGWLIIGTCIFRKHTVVADEDGRLYEITPQADALPFASHYPRIGVYDRMPEELFLLEPNEN